MEKKGRGGERERGRKRGREGEEGGEREREEERGRFDIVL